MKKAKLVKEELKKQGYKLKFASEMKVGPKLKTGIFGLDYILDGGIYQGEGGHRIELYGKENSGKTTFSLYLIKLYQGLAKKCVYINAEQSYDVDWAERIGVDNKKLLIAEPESLEQAGNMLGDFIGKYDLIIMDSVPAIVTQEELDGTMDNKHMASQAKVYSPMTRRLYSATKDHSPTIVFINQLREKVGIMFGSPYNTPGGRALKHFYNTRIEFVQGKMITKGVDKEKEVIGMEILLNCRKNKRGKPHRVTEIDFFLNGFIDNKKSLFYAGIKYGVISRTGNTYEFNDIKETGLEQFLVSLTGKNLTKLEEEIWKRIA